MNKSSQKIIEMFEVKVRTDEKLALSFEDILLSDYVKDMEAYIKGKDISMQILDTGSSIIGIMETTRNNNIPPKRNKRSKKIGRLGLADGEGLVYGNIFLYEKKRKILMYEVNKFGCYVDHFLLFLNVCCSEAKDCDWRFSIDIPPILNPNEYKRMKKMDFYKSLELQFSNPTALLEEYHHQNDSLSNAIEIGKKLHSEKFSCKFEVKSKRQGGTGLSQKTLRDMIDKVRSLLGTEIGSKNVKKVTVYGYAQDEDGGEKIEPIDLLVDRYIKHITLSEPRENVDLLPEQRKTKIKKLHKDCEADFAQMFGG